MGAIHLLDKRRFYLWLFIFSFGAVAWAVAQKKPQPEKRYVRWRLIEAPRKSLADSILVQLQQGVSFQKLARQHSLHTSAKQGGEIGWAALDSMDSDFKTAIVSLPGGGTSGILQKGNHFYILYKMKEFVEGEYLRWKEQKAEVDSLLKRVDLLLNKGNAPAAMTLIKDGEERVKQIGDEITYLRMLNFKGLALRRLSQFSDAAILFDSVLKISRNIGDTDWESAALGNLGNTKLMLGQYTQGIAYYDSALGIARAIGDRAGEGGWLGSLGNAYFLLGQYQRAIPYYDGALVIARKIGDRVREVRWLGNLGNIFGLLSQYQRSIAYYDSALGSARKIGDQAVEGKVLGNLGNIFGMLSQYQRAIAYFDSALSIARKIGDQHSEGAWLGGLGILYGELGQYQRTIAYYDSALIVARKIGDPVGEEKWLIGLGNAHHKSGRYSQVVTYYGSALSIARKIGDRLGEGMCLGSLGNTYRSLGQYHQAITYYDSALVIAREIGNREGEGVLLGDLGNVYRDLGQYPQAFAYADSGLSIAKEIGDAESIWRRYWSLARAHSKMRESKSNKVNNFYDNAVNALENITGQLIKDEHKLSFLEDKQELYNDYINYLVAQSENPDLDRALEISEASRTRALRDLLQGQRTQSALTEDKRREAIKRTEQLFAAHTATQNEPSAASVTTRASGKERLENWAKQIAIPPDTLASTASAPAIRMQEIQAEVRQHNATLLEYHVLDDGVVIWVVDQTGKVFAVKQNIAKEKLQALIDSVRQALEGEGFLALVKPAALSKKSRTLSQRAVLQKLDVLLIRPVRSCLPKDGNQPLVILPHDVLFLLPFACLMDSTGQYLTQRYTFSTAPSVGLLKFTREKTREQQNRENPKLLLMGNPRMPDEMWLPLPGAEKEVKLIANQVNNGKAAGPRQALPLIRAQATEVNFRQIASVHNYIHLATHGYVVSDALRCGLVLAKTGKTMETDGILTTAEIFGLPLHAELVVLSACQTGLGEISSDGVAGLSRAFLYAGASSLIVSLWSVSDEVTQELMVKFYEELAADGNKARALRAAQLATMKKYPRSKDWAAFVLVAQPR